MEITLKPGESINKTLQKLKTGDVIILDDGIYFEKVEVWTNDIKIKGKNHLGAIIYNMDYYHKIMPNHNECNTFNTFTVYVGADNVTIEDITITNGSTPSSIYGQAVALHVDGNHFTCNNCVISSAQDTLFTGPLPPDLLERYKYFYPKQRLAGKPSIQIYNKCQIVGDVDFIFGTGTVLFNECEIISIERKDCTGFICAPAHSKNQKFGYLFYKCNLKGKSATYLARPWRDYGSAAFILCNMEKHIIPAGFNKWNGTNRDQTARFFEYTLDTDLSKRESWIKLLTKEEAEKYVEDFNNFINLGDCF